MIAGTSVVLTALDVTNAETVRSWINDPEINRYMLVGHVPLTSAQEHAFYEAAGASDARYVFEIHAKDDMRLIGHVGLEGVDLRHRHGEVGIVIGDKDAQGRGFGRDAIVTILRFAFHTLGLHRVAIKAREDNARGTHLYASVGFVEVGRERESDFAEGRFFDVIEYDMLDREYEELYQRSAR